MKGLVDDSRRALIDVRVSAGPLSPSEMVTVWVDTAFNGHFVFNRALIQRLGLTQWAATEAVLADGSRVTLESYVAYVEWFETTVKVQVIANDGGLPLLGTELLDQRWLQIDYKARTVEVA